MAGFLIPLIADPELGFFIGRNQGQVFDINIINPDEAIAFPNLIDKVINSVLCSLYFYGYSAVIFITHITRHMAGMGNGRSHITKTYALNTTMYNQTFSNHFTSSLQWGGSSLFLINFDMKQGFCQIWKRGLWL